MQLQRQFWPELGIMYFSAKCKTGERLELISPYPELVFETPTVPVVMAGKFRGYNVHRPPLDWPALPSKTEGGILFPGMNILEALEDDSVYGCICAMTSQPTSVTPDMFTLDHVHIAMDEIHNFTHEAGYRAVVIMSGRVLDATTGLIYRPGQKVVVPEGGEARITALEASHTVGYKRTVT